MATGTQQQVISGIANYSQGQTVQIGNERYIITNQPQAGQFERMYVSGMSGWIGLVEYVRTNSFGRWLRPPPVYSENIYYICR